MIEILGDDELVQIFLSLDSEGDPRVLWPALLTCHRWRSIALRFPGLWKNLDARWRSATAFLLEQSKNAKLAIRWKHLDYPAEVDFDDESVYQELQLGLSKLHRVETLELSLPEEAWGYLRVTGLTDGLEGRGLGVGELRYLELRTTLHALRTSPPVVHLGQATKLRSLYLQGIGLNIEPRSCRFIYLRQLRFELHHTYEVSFTTLSAFLSQCRSLHELHLSDDRTGERLPNPGLSPIKAPVYNPPLMIHLPELSWPSLQVNRSDSCLLALPAHLRAPLATLHYNHTHASDGDPSPISIATAMRGLALDPPRWLSMATAVVRIVHHRSADSLSVSGWINDGPITGTGRSLFLASDFNVTRVVDEVPLSSTEDWIDFFLKWFDWSPCERVEIIGELADLRWDRILSVLRDSTTLRCIKVCDDLAPSLLLNLERGHDKGCFLPQLREINLELKTGVEVPDNLNNTIQGFRQLRGTGGSAGAYPALNVRVSQEFSVEILELL